MRAIGVGRHHIEKERRALPLRPQRLDQGQDRHLARTKPTSPQTFPKAAPVGQQPKECTLVAGLLPTTRTALSNFAHGVKYLHRVRRIFSQCARVAILSLLSPIGRRDQRSNRRITGRRTRSTNIKIREPRRIHFACTLFLISVMRATLRTYNYICLHFPASRASPTPPRFRMSAHTAEVAMSPGGERARRSWRSCSSGAARHVNASSLPVLRRSTTRRIRSA